MAINGTSGRGYQCKRINVENLLSQQAIGPTTIVVSLDIVWSLFYFFVCNIWFIYSLYIKSL